ncbi:2,3-bisphosphoglycerate-independent phosphoglycerate mutase [Paraconexibacter sp. AEG42_29]|uniref:2,3-bisphosphoglycerate-independent phosphoglycerate mutase n=1 Tax=Paraconexibacter sp. AEG42_29 TaxID=2997339 RepID=A0AAU7AT85_9ACTN
MSHPSVCLVILDGWGLAPDGPGNAVSLAHTPIFDELWDRYPHTQLTACGRAVGLPDGQMGNSEVGHLNLGAGAVVRQDLTRIDDAVADGTLASNPTLRAAFEGFERVHLMGLVSDGGVHSSDQHLKALIELGGELGVKELVVHAFTDGRDTLPKAGAGFVGEVDAWCAALAPGTDARVGTVIGRYYGMDRDQRAERTGMAVDLLVDGTGAYVADDGADAVQQAYDRDETDEFVAATVVGGESRVRPQDSVLAFNFRPDRMRQITAALAPKVARYTSLTEYDETWDWPVAFGPERPAVTLAQVIAAGGGRQVHAAETEKYPHVTYFFNGGEEQPYEGERREVVPSPRDVATYDLKPEMSARGAADAFLAAWGQDSPQFGVINFANADMVGHTGVIPAAVEAIETVDRCLGDIVLSVQRSGGVLIITADHGNADNMLEPDGSPNTAHSLNPVPLIVTDEDVAPLRSGGVLADVAPTVLELLGIAQPAEMTGVSLLG